MLGAPDSAQRAAAAQAAAAKCVRSRACGWHQPARKWLLFPKWVVSFFACTVDIFRMSSLFITMGVQTDVYIIDTQARRRIDNHSTKFIFTDAQGNAPPVSSVCVTHARTLLSVGQSWVRLRRIWTAIRSRQDEIRFVIAPRRQTSQGRGWNMRSLIDWLRLTACVRCASPTVFASERIAAGQSTPRCTFETRRMAVWNDYLWVCV